MTNTIEGYIGCPEHGAFFRLEAVPGTNPGVFEHDVVQIGDAAPGAKHCPECQAVLTRVPAPE